MKHAAIAPLVIVAALLPGAVPAEAGLIYDWVSLEVLQGGKLPLDPESVSGSLGLRNRTSLGEIAAGDDVASFHFIDPGGDPWGLDNRLLAQFIPDFEGLGVGKPGGARLKEAFVDLTRAVKIDRTVTALSFSTLLPKGKLPKLAKGDARWFWQLTFRDASSKEPTLLYSGQGYWQIDASSVGVPEPGTLLLLLGGLAALRWRPR